MSLATLAARLYRALKMKPCGCGWHIVTVAHKKVRIEMTCQRCRVIADYENSEFCAGPLDA